MSENDIYAPPQELNDAEPQPKKKAPARHVWLIVIAILLFLQLGVSGFRLYLDIARDQRLAAERASMAQSISQYAATMDNVSSQLLQQYKKEVYGGGKVDTVEKQIVMGTEYNFMGLMLLARQNTEMLKALTMLK